MEIRKILNNNAVITYDDRNKEIILLGKGLAYGKKVGDPIDMIKVTKIFDVGIKESQKKLINLLVDIPIDYMEISDAVIKKAKKEIPTEIDDSLYISLTDHIHTSIERYKEDIKLKNQMFLEIKHLYKKEFELGLWALELIKLKYDIEMCEDEAAFIAMHIVSSEVGNKVDKTYEITTFIQSIIDIVEGFFSEKFDENTLSYYRFVTHLKHFAFRLFRETQYTQEEPLNNDLLEILKEKYVKAYLCVLKMVGFIEKNYDYQLEDEEILYLTIHVAKVVSESKGGQIKK